MQKQLSSQIEADKNAFKSYSYRHACQGSVHGSLRMGPHGEAHRIHPCPKADRQAGNIAQGADTAVQRELARHRSCRVFVPYPGTFSMCRSASFHALEFGTLTGIKRKIMKMNYLPCSLAESCPHLDGAYPNCATAKSCSWINTTLRSITLGLLFSA